MGWWSKLRQYFQADPGPRYDGFDADRIQAVIGYAFHHPELLYLALTHRSYVRSNGGEVPSNERLEFLGDSVLGLVIADRLYRDYPECAEGDLTKTKALLVNETTLAAIGQETGLNEHIIMSAEEERSGGRQRPSIIADAVESVIAAVYLDGGLEMARDLVMRLIYARRDVITADESQRNYKGDLLELTQSQGIGVPRYDVISEDGPDHEKVFHVVVSVAGRRVGDGQGTSKKEAEQKAARMALDDYLNGARDHERS